MCKSIHIFSNGKHGKNNEKRLFVYKFILQFSLELILSIYKEYGCLKISWKTENINEKKIVAGS